MRFRRRRQPTSHSSAPQSGARPPDGRYIKHSQDLLEWPGNCYNFVLALEPRPQLPLINYYTFNK